MRVSNEAIEFAREYGVLTDLLSVGSTSSWSPQTAEVRLAPFGLSLQDLFPRSARFFGYSLSGLHRIAGSELTPTKAPDWVHLLARLGPSRLAHTHSMTAIGEAWAAGVVATAWPTLAPRAETWLESSAIASLHLYLADALAPALKAVGMLEWQVIRATSLPDRWAAERNSLLNGPLLVSLRRYPFVLRWLFVTLSNFAQSLEKLRTRLQRDRSKLAEGLDVPLGKVSDLRWGLGDTHNRGASVAALRVGDRRFVYKPRSVAGEVLWGKVGRALSDVVEQYLPRIVDRGTYGWVEYLQPTEFADAKVWVSRLAGVGAQAFLLGASDLHYENVLCVRGLPTVIDAETMIPFGRGTFALWTTGILPLPSTTSSPLIGAREGGAASIWRVRGEALNEEWTLEEVEWGPQTGLPQVSDDDLATLPEALARALSGTWPLRARVEQILRREVRAGTRLRSLLRPTVRYTELIRSSFEGELCDRTPADQAFRFAGALRRGLPKSPSFRLALASEVAALMAGDIPYFATEPARGRLLAEFGTVLPSVRPTPLSRAITHVRGISPHRTRREVAAYRGLLRAAVPGVEVVPANLDDALRFLVGRVRREEVGSGRGLAEWLTFGEGGKIRGAGHAWYWGATGTLSATLHAARSCGDAVATIWASKEAQGFRTRQTRSLLDLGSIALLHACALATDSGGHPAWRVPADVAPASCDATDGVALVLRGVSAAARAGDAHARLLVQALVERLSSAQTSDGAWPLDPNGRAIQGFAHGPAGITAALAEALPHLPPSALDRAVTTIRRGLEWENTHFLPGEGRWRDLRGGGADPANWCGGSAGIGMGRLTILRIAAAVPALAEVRDVASRDLEAAIAHVRSTPMHGDSLCCGLAGRVDFLLDAADWTGDPVVRAAATEAGEELFRRLRAGPAIESTSFGLMQGLPGVMYALARFQDPTLPSLFGPRLGS